MLADSSVSTGMQVSVLEAEVSPVSSKTGIQKVCRTLIDRGYKKQCLKENHTYLHTICRLT